MHFLHDHAPTSLQTDAYDFGVGVIILTCFIDLMYLSSLSPPVLVCVSVCVCVHLSS
jgi:hypothetical protein